MSVALELLLVSCHFFLFELVVARHPGDGDESGEPEGAIVQ